MHFVDAWFPLIVMVREGRLDRPELDQLFAGFERHFERGRTYAVLSVSLASAPPPDALARMRMAEWLNQPRVRRYSKALCAGSATVAARAWERRVLTALSWLWVPIAPHRAVASVVEGISYCADRLVARQVRLPTGREHLEREVYRALATLPIAGLAEVHPGSKTRPSQSASSKQHLSSNS